MTPREAIIAAVQQRLEVIDGVEEVKRLPFADPLRFPALHIFDGGHRILDSEPQVTRYVIDLTIEGYLEAAGGEEAHAALQALYAKVVASLLTEPPLGGLAETIEEGDLRILIAPLAGKSRLCLGLDLAITFPTRRGNPALTA